MKYQLELNDYDVDFLKLCIYGFREYQKNQIPDIKSSMAFYDMLDNDKTIYQVYKGMLKSCEDLINTSNNWLNKLDEIK